MMHWNQVEALFVAILDLPPESRRTFLSSSPQDASVRDSVARLLSAHEKAEGFLEQLDAQRAAALLDAVEAPIEIGRQLGPYQVIRELGRGGMGVVYLAQDNRLDRPVALKFLSPHLNTDERAKQRLIREAKAASTLDHPNIGVVHEIGETDEGQLFIAMTYYEGPTLHEAVGMGPMAVDRSISLIRQLADGLRAAHAKGIVHRDVKPGNVILTDRDVPKLVDFGIAKAQRLNVTEEGARLGTVSYMSPEQTRGDATDARSDLWSLGVMFYEMVTGERPFRGAHEDAIIYCIRHDVPDRVERQRLDVPAEISRIIEKLLQKDPAARYPSADALSADLSAKLGQEHVLRSGHNIKQTFSLIGAMAVLSVVLVIAGVNAWRQLDDADAPASAWDVQGQRPMRLAVLPLASLSREPDDEYVAEGLTDELISRLSRLEGLHVIARTSVMKYKGGHMNVAEIGAELGVGMILEGSMRTTGDRVRLTVQLVDAASQQHLWTEDFDTQMADVLALQSEIAQQVAQALHVRMQERERVQLAKKGTDIPEAHLLYLKGRYFWNKRTAAWFKQSQAYFQQSLDLDPTYAQAWAGLADVYLMLGSIGELSPSESYSRATTAAERALALDSELAEALTTLATVHLDHYEWEEARRYFERALSANPGYALAHQRFSLYLSVVRDHPKAVEVALRARSLDPLSVYAGASAGYGLYLARRYDEAADHLHEIEKMDPSFFLTQLDLGLVYVQQEKFEDAIVAFEKGVALSDGDPSVIGLLGYAFGIAGSRADAVLRLGDLDSLSMNRYVSPFHRAMIHLGLEEKAETLDLLEQAYEERAWHMILLNVEPLFDGIRSEPRFQSLLEKMGLQAMGPAT